MYAKILQRFSGTSAPFYYNDVIMSAVASQITSVSSICSAGCYGADEKKTSKLRVTGLCELNSPVTGEFPHKGPVTRRMFPFDDLIMFVPHSYKFMLSLHCAVAHKPYGSVWSYQHHLSSLQCNTSQTFVSNLQPSVYEVHFHIFIWRLIR